MCSQADQKRQGICLWSDSRRDQRIPWDIKRTGKKQSIQRSLCGRKFRIVRGNAWRKIWRWGASAPCQNWYGITEYQHARSDSLPCSTHDAPQYRRSMVYLSDVWFRTSDRGCYWEDYPLHLYIGIWRSQTALWLGSQRMWVWSSTETDWVCKTVSDECCDRKALYQETGWRWNCGWMGWSKISFHRSAQKKRIYTGID